MATIRQAQSLDKAVWDDFVNNNINATAYSYFAWKESVEIAYGHKGIYLIAEDNGVICGALPLIIFRNPLGGSSLISLPYCDTGEVLARDSFIRDQLIRTAVELVESLSLNCLEIRSSLEGLFDNISPDNVDVQTNKVRMLLRLPGSSALLWEGFKSKLRSQIRKAEKNGLTFCWGNVADLEPFYQVFGRNMLMLGSPVHSRRWIREIITRFGGAVKVGLVLAGSRVIGCGIILSTLNTVSIPWASTLREFNYLSPNMMLYWNFLKFAADNKKKVFDFGRSTPGEGTYRFKKQWGAQPNPLYWYRYPFDGSVHRQRIAFKSSNRKILASMWANMPLWAANILGPSMRKYISL